MHKIIAATIISLSLATPAFAYNTRPVEFDPAAELQRTTGSAQYPESAGGIMREGRVSNGGSQAYPQPTGGIPHAGADMMVGSSSRFPVLTPDALNHPPSALHQDQMLVHEFDDYGLAPASVAGELSGASGG